MRTDFDSDVSRFWKLGPVIMFVCALPRVNGAGETNAAVFGLFPLYIMIAYAVGAPIAFLAGLMVSIWMLARAPSFVVVHSCCANASGMRMQPCEAG